MKKYEPKRMVASGRYQNYFPTLPAEIQQDVYGGLLIFALYPALPDQPPVSELQDFVQKLFMGPFTKLGKIFNLNRPSHMWLIDKVFRKSGNRDRKDILKYPEGFVNIDAPMIRSVMQRATASRSARTRNSPKSTVCFMCCHFCATAISSESARSMGH